MKKYWVLITVVSISLLASAGLYRTYFHNRAVFTLKDFPQAAKIDGRIDSTEEAVVKVKELGLETRVPFDKFKDKNATWLVSVAMRAPGFNGSLYKAQLKKKNINTTQYSELRVKDDQRPHYWEVKYIASGQFYSCSFAITEGGQRLESYDFCP